MPASFDVCIYRTFQLASRSSSRTVTNDFIHVLKKKELCKGPRNICELNIVMAGALAYRILQVFHDHRLLDTKVTCPELVRFLDSALQPLTPGMSWDDRRRFRGQYCMIYSFFRTFWRSVAVRVTNLLHFIKADPDAAFV